MLHSLEIQNYRNLKHLTIERLGRVNLLIGKNNTGKTSVLEAIAIHINRGDIQFLLQLQTERGENYVRNDVSESGGTEIINALRTLSAMFSGRQIQFAQQNAILVGELKDTLFGPLTDTHNRTRIRLVRFTEKYEFSDNAPSDIPRRRRTILDDDSDDSEAILGLEVLSNQSNILIRLKNIERGSRRINVAHLSRPNSQKSNYQFVRTKNIERDINGTLWDKISLTKSEDEIINALRIIEQDIDRITFRNENELERIPVVKLRSSNDVVPLRAMGDGINRILTIILAMVNCENGYFLIDEFENGLHYSVQEQLWKVVFNVAERLNIQVFATTHSHDCIEAFASVLGSDQAKKDFGYMIRLDNYDGNIEATLYDSEEIQTTTRVHVDPR